MRAKRERMAAEPRGNDEEDVVWALRTKHGLAVHEGRIDLAVLEDANGLRSTSLGIIEFEADHVGGVAELGTHPVVSLADQCDPGTDDAELHIRGGRRFTRLALWQKAHLAHYPTDCQDDLRVLGSDTDTKSWSHFSLALRAEKDLERSVQYNTLSKKSIF
jgi:hypothetical protein